MSGGDFVAALAGMARPCLAHRSRRARPGAVVAVGHDFRGQRQSAAWATRPRRKATTVVNIRRAARREWATRELIAGWEGGTGTSPVRIQR